MSDGKSHRPPLSVVMAIRNGVSWLSEALVSLQQQTFSDFEIILVDDGSTDGGFDLACDWARRESRITAVEQSGGRGLAFALNRAAGLARGELIARMDCDDLAHSERFAIQCAFLGEHPEISVCGTSVRTFGRGTRGVWVYPTTDSRIRATLCFRSAFAHPTVIMRREAFAAVGGYRSNLSTSQDYDLWCRGERLGWRFSNLSIPLLDYRVHAAQVTLQRHELVRRNSSDIRARHLHAVAPELTAEELDLHNRVCEGNLSSRTELATAEQWLLRLCDWNRRHRVYSKADWKSVLAVQWIETCRECLPSHPRALITYFRSPLFQVHALPLRRHVRLCLDLFLRRRR